MKCMLCGIETRGSVGRAGIEWKSICQECKDMEDYWAEKVCVTQAKAINAALQLLEEAI